MSANNGHDTIEIDLTNDNIEDQSQTIQSSTEKVVAAAIVVLRWLTDHIGQGVLLAAGILALLAIEEAEVSVQSVLEEFQLLESLLRQSIPSGPHLRTP